MRRKLNDRLLPPELRELKDSNRGMGTTTFEEKSWRPDEECLSVLDDPVRIGTLRPSWAWGLHIEGNHLVGTKVLLPLTCHPEPCSKLPEVCGSYGRR